MVEGATLTNATPSNELRLKLAVSTNLAHVVLSRRLEGRSDFFLAHPLMRGSPRNRKVY